MSVSLIELAGRPDGPPLPLPPALLDTVGWLGDSLGIDAVDALTERARLLGFDRRGDATCGGAGRLLAAADGWIALSLARPDDLDLLPAWLGVEAGGDDPWPVVAGAVAGHRAAELVELGGLLGLAVAGVGEVAWTGGPVVGGQLVGDARPVGGDLDGIHVVDCSSLWAGPLCVRVLQDRGARVTRLESPRRPDGARNGSPEFFAALHRDQGQHWADPSTEGGLEEWLEVLRSADVVVEASRPRAFAQLGIDARRLLADGRPRVWISITAHGRVTAPHRVGFGDDAAAAGGLVAWDERGPCFVGDAVADPLTGLFAARAALAALERGGCWILDAGLSRCAAFSARGAGSRSPRR